LLLDKRSVLERKKTSKSPRKKGIARGKVGEGAHEKSDVNKGKETNITLEGGGSLRANMVN